MPISNFLLILSLVAKAVLLVHTFLTDLLLFSTGEMRPIKSNLTLKTSSTLFNVTAAIYNDLMNIAVP